MKLVCHTLCLLLLFSAPAAFSQKVKTAAPTKITSPVKPKITAPGKQKLQPKILLSPEQELRMALDKLQLEKITVSAYADTKFVLVKWTFIKNVEGFNVYRKKSGESYKKLNTTLITWPQTSTAETEICRTWSQHMPAKKYPREHKHIAKLDEFEFCPHFSNQNKSQALVSLGQLYYPLCIGMGCAFVDSTAQKGTVYYYKVTSVDEKNNENDLGQAHVIAGTVKKMSQPSGLQAQAGDTKALLLWNDPPAADTLAGYYVYRSLSANGLFTRVDSIPVVTKITINLKGDSLTTPQYGFIDTALVNNKTYYYKVAPRDPLMHAGSKSATVQVKPYDQTQPKIPGNVNITSLDSVTLLISWNLVTKDTAGRTEKVKGYHIYRYPDYQTAEDPTSSATLYKIGYVAHPAPPKPVKTKSGFYMLYIQEGPADTSFKDGTVKPENVYWYRIACEDSAGNMGNKTAAVYGILPDITPPDPPTFTSLTGDSACMTLTWQAPDVFKKENQDLAGYKIYRGICGTNVYDKETHKCITCYDLSLLVDITDTATLTYKDCSLPKESPLCYRYAVKAYDKSQNMSVFSDSLCARLQDRTPPEAPIITALRARNKAIHIECVAEPIQDFKGFVVERRENSEKTFQRVYQDSIPKSVTCADIPVSADSILANKVNQLSFTDKNVSAEKIYWYRARAFDQNGNMSKACPAVSTYTYEVKQVSQPLKLTVKQKRCSAILTWRDENVQNKDFIGYAVFRSVTDQNNYRQISGLIKENKYTDIDLVQEMSVWYCVQTFYKNGDRSPLSSAVGVTIK